MQSRRLSAVEAVVNVAVGYAVALGLTAVVLPGYGYAVSAPDAAAISAVFTGASLLRSYLIRRLFDGHQGT